MSRLTGLLAAGLLALASPVRTQSDPLAGWWDSADPAARAAVATAVVRSRASFQAVYRALRDGPPADRMVPTGLLDRVYRASDGLDHPYQIVVPSAYDPTRRYPVRFYLHGGVGRAQPGTWKDPEETATPDVIAVFPSGWAQSVWWEWAQVETFHAIVAELARVYRIDENQVSLYGQSDGGTGAWYQAFKAPTMWSAYLILIGHPAVLANPRFQSSGELFPRNLSHQAFFVANARNDRLYPSASMMPYVEAFRRAGATVAFTEKDGDHSVAWMPEERPAMDRFLAAHPRRPLPDTLDWETERVDRGNRVSWLVIDELGSEPARRDAFPGDLFPHRRPAGRVHLERHGNGIVARTWNVRRFTVLLSPERIDFARPVDVAVDGRRVWRGRLTPSVATLLSWAARDADRGLLFGAALEITVPEQGAATVVVRE